MPSMERTQPGSVRQAKGLPAAAPQGCWKEAVAVARNVAECDRINVSERVREGMRLAVWVRVAVRELGMAAVPVGVADELAVAVRDLGMAKVPG